jgi:hypothetical protein
LTTIEVEILNHEGFPRFTAVKKRGNKLELEYDPNKGFTLKGNRRSLADNDLMRALSFVYPTGAIPDPKISPLTLLDSGRTIYASVDDLQNATALLYTVPVDRTFYLYLIDVNTYPDNPAAGTHGGSVYYNDGIDDYDITVIGEATGGTGTHTSIGFNCLKFPSDWTFHVFSDANSHVHVTLLGVLV